ncbi:hypothetical protein CAPTEDRAFT_213971 [Capitella teleta]|uniref:GPR180/TMEM145 transmembrane domain-containing protein n=1 Tax=Capitella teleta TaxID=283909 RepID=R7TN19_CAPTE|nr:hypothetical protein CAPTEDRAFT_213971 [Capitella teleta]|eukprot:ELT95258.1 hypothetical protein CAPTEDRAFT_213971 [Capitella teleta]
MLPLLLTICLCMEFVGVIFNFIHVFKFAFDGSGVELLKVTGNFIDNVAQCLFMLLLLLIVKGWTITRMSLTMKAKIILFTIWGTYTVSIMALFVWNLGNGCIRLIGLMMSFDTVYLTCICKNV